MNPEEPRPEGEAEPATATPAAPVRFRTDVRGMMAIVACVGLVLWTGMNLSEGLDPTRSVTAGLRSSSWVRRIEAAEKLITMPDVDTRVAVPALAASVGDDVPRARLAIITSLGALTNQAIQEHRPGNIVQAGIAGLLRSLADSEPTARQMAVNSLAEVARSRFAQTTDRRPIAAAIAEILADPDPAVRLSGFRALALLGSDDEKAPAPLVAALEDPDLEVRAAAFGALSSFPRGLDEHLPLLLRNLKQGDTRMVSSVAWAFHPDRPTGFTPKVMPELIPALRDRSRVVRRAAAGILCQIPTEPITAAAIPALMAILREPGGESRGYDPDDPVPIAARALGRIAPGRPGAVEVVDAITELARSESAGRREAAIQALGEFGPLAEPAVPFLIERFRGGIARPGRASSPISEAIPRSLARIAPGTKSAGATAAVLIEALEPDANVPGTLQLGVVQSLGSFGDEAAAALPRLRELQKGPDRQLQEAAENVIALIEQAGTETRTEAAKSRAGGRPAG